MAKTIKTISDLTPDSANVNKGTERGHYLIDYSITELGAGRSILADADGVVVAGNKTLEVAADHQLPIRVIQTDGKELVVVQRTDLRLTGKGAERDRARKLAIADNRASEVGYSANIETLLEHAQSGVDLSAMYRQDELDALIESLTPDMKSPGAGGDEFDAEPEEAQTRVQYGDLWQCGEHRVLCGDSTKAEDVARVMDGQKAEMMFTDPPYGVNYEGGHFHSGDVNIKRKREELDNDHDTAIYANFLPVALSAVDGPCYMWFAGSKARDVYNTVFDAGCEVHALIIWHKTNATYAAMNAQYKQRHEPCLYFKPKGSTLRWCGASTEATVWSQDRDGINEFHPTQKPIALAMKAIQNHKAKTIADFFGGSGSTLIACERTNRKARVIEIEPKYVNVILSRWEAETGKEAKLLDRVNA